MDTKEEILDVALDLFAGQGFHGTSIREIAEGVGIRKSSIYNHFKSKEDILEQLFVSFGPGSIKKELKSKKLQSKLDQPYQFLKTFADLTLKMMEDKREQKAIQIMFREHTNKTIRKKAKQKFLEEDRMIVADCFKQMMEQGLIKDNDPLFLANEFIGPLAYTRIQYILLTLEEEPTEQMYSFLEQHIDFFWQAIKK